MNERTQRLIDRLNDPTLVEIPGYDGFADPGERRFVRRSTLAQLTRIESLRWRALHVWNSLNRRRNAVVHEALNYGELFIPSDCFPKSCPYSLPRRVVVEKSRHYDGLTTCVDDDYWRHNPAKLVADKSPLGQLARLGDIREWEAECAQRAALIDPAKLDLGRRYHRLDTRVRRLGARIGRINALIEFATRGLGLVKADNFYAPKRLVSLEINGRYYGFDVGGHCVKGRVEYWPHIGETQVVRVPDRFVLNEACIGLDHEAVLTRFGAPDRVDSLPAALSLEEGILGGEIWVYGDSGVVMSRHKTVVRLV